MDLKWALRRKGETDAEFVTSVEKAARKLAHSLTEYQHDLFQAIMADTSIPYDERVENAERLLTIDERNSLQKGERKE